MEIIERREKLAHDIVDRHFREDRTLDGRYPGDGRRKCVDDVRHSLLYLAEAVAADSPALFANYVAWIKGLFANLGIPVEHLKDNLAVMATVLNDSIPAPEGPAAAAIIQGALAGFDAIPLQVETFLDETSGSHPIARQFLDALLAGDRVQATRMVADLFAAGSTVKDIYVRVFEPVLREVGRLWHANAVTVAQEHFVTAAVQMSMSQFYPHIFSTPRCSRILVAACVSGELHEIGVRIVADHFEMAGWTTYYLGANTPPAAVVQAVADRGADVLAISATIAAHLSKVREMIAALRREAATSRVRILVGGYPFNIDRDLWRRIGADGCGCDAKEAVALGNALAETAA